MTVGDLLFRLNSLTIQHVFNNKLGTFKDKDIKIRVDGGEGWTDLSGVVVAESGDNIEVILFPRHPVTLK